MLYTVRLHLAAASSVVPLISLVVGDRVDRAAVVEDVVECWLALPEAVRGAYRAGSPSELDGLERFGWDYVEEVDRAALAHLPPGADLTDEDAERLVHQHWRTHLRRIGAGPVGAGAVESGPVVTR